MVDDFLSLATIQAGTFKLERRRAGLHVLLNEFYEDALFISREKDVSFVMLRGPEVFIAADVIRIREVLFNLFDNAIKHTPSKGSIRLGYEVRDQEVILQFGDSGSGIPENELPRIFNFFDKGHGNGQGVHGAGLGLALVKCIIEAHHGTIAVDSELNKGTTFTIKLPVA
jgi:signal transduction histidine kinase